MASEMLSDSSLSKDGLHQHCHGKTMLAGARVVAARDAGP